MVGLAIKEFSVLWDNSCVLCADIAVARIKLSRYFGPYKIIFMTMFLLLSIFPTFSKDSVLVMPKSSSYLPSFCVNVTTAKSENTT